MDSNRRTVAERDLTRTAASPKVRPRSELRFQAVVVFSETPLLVGVDGGATEVKAHAIVEVAAGLELGDARAAFRYETVAGFTPLPLALQLAARDAGDIRIGALEHEQGERWIEAFTHAVTSIAACTQRAHVVVGVCAPGLKTRDGRGIAVSKNGPRIPDFNDRLEARLAREGLVLARGLPRLASDGDACGHGENACASGGLRDVVNAYYLGGGTGLAECFKLGGRIVGLDELDGRVVKAWALASSRGRSYEEHLSMRGINARFVELGGRAGTTPESAASRGEKAAIETFGECAKMLGELVGLRSAAMRELRDVALERVVVGQRLGNLFVDPALRAHLRAPADRACSIPIHPSTLREAPAIGAARCALDALANGRAAHG